MKKKITQNERKNFIRNTKTKNNIVKKMLQCDFFDKYTKEYINDHIRITQSYSELNGNVYTIDNYMFASFENIFKLSYIDMVLNMLHNKKMSTKKIIEKLNNYNIIGKIIGKIIENPDNILVHDLYDIFDMSDIDDEFVNNTLIALKKYNTNIIIHKDFLIYKLKTTNAKITIHDKDIQKIMNKFSIHSYKNINFVPEQNIEYYNFDSELNYYNFNLYFVISNSLYTFFREDDYVYISNYVDDFKKCQDFFQSELYTQDNTFKKINKNNIIFSQKLYKTKVIENIFNV